MPRRILVAAIVLIVVAYSRVADATVWTNTRPEVAQMAAMWEVTTIDISPLANAQYPNIGGGTSLWQYAFPSSSTASDGDLHHAMAIDASGTGSTGNNIGNAPIIAEIVNCSGSQQSTVNSLVSATNHRVVPRGIFRVYTEHANEIHYEAHPVTEELTYNGSAWVVGADMRSSITNDPYARHGYALSTMQNLVNGSITMSAQVLADNNRVVLNYPSGAGAATMNYPEYDGRVMQPLTNDVCGLYFTFLPTNSPAGAITGARVMRCRIVTNTHDAPIATGLVSNMAVNVNALNRIDMLVMSNTIASLSANQSTNFVRPVEFIVLGLKAYGPISPPTVTFSGTPTNGTAPLTVTFTDGSSGSITNRFWDFGDGGTSNTTASSVQYTYNGVGTNTVRLIVSGLGGSGTNSQPNYVVVGSAGPPPPLDPYVAWQLQYFNCTNCPEAEADADPLGKGMSNTNQFLAGLNPTNPASVFRITSVAADSSNNVLITWSTAGVRTNAVQAASGDAEGSYTNAFDDIGGLIVLPVAGDATTNYIDIGGATNAPARYYRIRLVP
jgi:PKD repeat protein